LIIKKKRSEVLSFALDFSLNSDLIGFSIHKPKLGSCPLYKCFCKYFKENILYSPSEPVYEDSMWKQEEREFEFHFAKNLQKQFLNATPKLLLCQ